MSNKILYYFLQRNFSIGSMFEIGSEPPESTTYPVPDCDKNVGSATLMFIIRCIFAC